MERRHKDAITRNRVMLTEELILDNRFLDFFRPDNRLMDNHIEEIMTKATKYDRVSHFLSLLTRRGPQAMDCFMQALCFTGQEHLADLVDPQMSSKFRMMVGKSGPLTNVQPTTGGTAGGFFTQARRPPIKLDDDEEDSPFIEVKVNNIDPHDPIFQQSIKNSDGVYKMTKEKRGRALIINNENFMEEAKLGTREGSQFDLLNLDKLLEQLGYTTEVKSDLTGEEIVSAIIEERNNEAHKEAEGFILAMFSHGAQGSIYGRDGKQVPIAEIKAAFDGKNCQALAGKPKLFIIQACQGRQATHGVPVADADGSEDDPISEGLQKLRLGDGDNPDAVPWTSRNMGHEKGDMLVAYSTVSGYKSWRLPEKGSWFIRILVKVFMYYADQEHVADLLTKVREEVSKKTTNYTAGGLYVQMPADDNTLRKKWYFFPGYHE